MLSETIPEPFHAFVPGLSLFLVIGAADYMNGSAIPIEGGILNASSQSFGDMLLSAVG